MKPPTFSLLTNTLYMSPKGWVVISNNGNNITATGVAKEADGGLIAFAMEEQNMKEGRLELNGCKVLVATKNDSIYALYY